MSNPIRDCANAHKRTGEMLNDFLYEDGKPLLKGGKPGVRKDHTKEELEQMLEGILISSFENYNDIANELGWE
ncbi:MAG: hypothetical protein K0R00_38 [Herbinix sp.]|jgi:hypothetical protein|nr:hypothetical protein [Herbinix sp.]